MQINEVHLGYNSEIDDECMTSIGECIMNNRWIERISLNNTKVSDAGIEILAQYLEGNKTLKHIILDGNARITEKSFPIFMKIIESSYVGFMAVDSIAPQLLSALTVPLACNAIKNGSDIISLYQK